MKGGSGREETTPRRGGKERTVIEYKLELKSKRWERTERRFEKPE